MRESRSIFRIHDRSDRTTALGSTAATASRPYPASGGRGGGESERRRRRRRSGGESGRRERGCGGKPRKIRPFTDEALHPRFALRFWKTSERGERNQRNQASDLSADTAPHVRTCQLCVSFPLSDASILCKRVCLSVGLSVTLSSILLFLLFLFLFFYFFSFFSSRCFVVYGSRSKIKKVIRAQQESKIIKKRTAVQTISNTLRCALALRGPSTKGPRKIFF